MRRPSRPLLLGVVSLIVIAVGATWLWMRGSASRARPEVSSVETRVAPQSKRDGGERTDGAEPIVDLPPIAPPTSDWLAHPPNPITVAVHVLDRGTDRDKISPAGGELSVAAPDGTRVTLTIPTGALIQSTEMTLSVVDQISGLPFSGGLLFAVRFGPESVMLRQPSRLVIETSRTRPVDAAQPLAALAVQGTEMHLYPAARIEGERARSRPRVLFPLTRTGTYGVALVTREEIAAAGARQPTDYLARLEQRAGLVLTPTAPAPPKVGTRWTLLPALHAAQPQSSSAEGGELIVSIQQLMTSTREFYNQVVIPKFDRIPKGDCLRSAAATFDAIRTSYEWSSFIQLILPVKGFAGVMSPEVLSAHQKLVAERSELLHLNYYLSEREIQLLDAWIENFREELENLEGALAPKRAEALTNQFHASYSCCTSGQRPLRYQLDTMFKIEHMAATMSVSVDSDPVAKIRECACMAASSVPGAKEHLIGTLSYSENFEGEVSERIGNGVQKHSLKLDYRMSFDLAYPLAESDVAVLIPNGEMEKAEYAKTLAHVADVAVNASMRSRTYKSNPLVGCIGEKEGDLNVKGTDSGQGIVDITVLPDGTYQLSVDLLFPDGTGTSRDYSHYEGDNCGAFTFKNDNWDKLNFASISIVPAGPGSLIVKGRIDPSRPRELKGSQTFEIEDREYKTVRKPKLEWNIQRCQF